MTPENQAAESPKAWDLKDLENRLKQKGLPVLEEGAKELFAAICEWSEYGLKNDSSKVNDFALVVLPPFRSLVEEKLGGISK